MLRDQLHTYQKDLVVLKQEVIGDVDRDRSLEHVWTEDEPQV